MTRESTKNRENKQEKVCCGGTEDQESRSQASPEDQRDVAET